MPQEISLIPKERKERKGLLMLIGSKLGILAMALIILSLLIYGGLTFYKNRLEEDLFLLKTRIEELNQNRDRNFEKEVKSLDQALKNLKIILQNHVYWSNLFSVIEKLVVPQVTFSEFSSKIEKGDSVVSMAGETSGYTYLAKQIRSFEQHSLISGSKVRNISLGTKGGIEFEMDIIFKRGVLKK